MLVSKRVVDPGSFQLSRSGVAGSPELPDMAITSQAMDAHAIQITLNNPKPQTLHPLCTWPGHILFELPGRDEELGWETRVPLTPTIRDL